MSKREFRYMSSCKCGWISGYRYAAIRPCQRCGSDVKEDNVVCSRRHRVLRGCFGRPVHVLTKWKIFKKNP